MILELGVLARVRFVCAGMTLNEHFSVRKSEAKNFEIKTKRNYHTVKTLHEDVLFCQFMDHNFLLHFIVIIQLLSDDYDFKTKIKIC